MFNRLRVSENVYKSILQYYIFDEYCIGIALVLHWYCIGIAFGIALFMHP